MTVEQLFALTARRAPALAVPFAPSGTEHRGSSLADPQWLAARVTDTARRWGGADDRVSGTLWWYSASSVLIGAALGVRLATGFWLDPDPACATVYVDGHGMLLATRPSGIVREGGATEQVGGAWRRALTSIVDPLAQVSGAGRASLWAIASDSLANRALEVGRVLGDPAAGREVALVLAESVGSALPAPRFVEVGGSAGLRLFCRRNSCCLIDQTGLAERCVSCPRRHPDDRARLLGWPR